MAGIPTFTTRSWLSLVLAAEPDFYHESRHPVVYEWSSGRHRRDPGDGGGPYANNAVQQQAYVTEDAGHAFVNEAGDATFVTEIKG